MYKINDLFDLTKTIAADIFNGREYPWDVIPDISEYIFKLGATLSEDEYDNSLID